MRVPLVDLASQFAEVEDSVRSGWDEVIRDTAFIGGSAVSDFEADYAEYVGTAHCIGVANGTDAIELALRAAGVGPKGEVIVPANTFVATAEAVVRAGATPVPVDVDAKHLLIDPDLVAAAVTPQTQAIIPVHLFGQSAPMEQLMPIAEKAGVAIVEDVAQAQGARRHGRMAGSWGIAAATSFYPGKNLGALGDAGGVTTDGSDLARRVRLLGAHGSEVKYQHDVVGFNSRMDTLQAVVLQAKLKRLDRWNGLRRAAARRYDELLSGVDGLDLPQVAEGNDDVWHLYVVRVAERDRVLEDLRSAGIDAGIHYPTPIHITEAFKDLGYPLGSFPVAERASGEILSLPIYPHITPEAQELVSSTLRTALAARS